MFLSKVLSIIIKYVSNYLNIDIISDILLTYIEIANRCCDLSPDMTFTDQQNQDLITQKNNIKILKYITIDNIITIVFVISSGSVLIYIVNYYYFDHLLELIQNFKDFFIPPPPPRPINPGIVLGRASPIYQRFFHEEHITLMNDYRLKRYKEFLKKLKEEQLED